MADLYNKDGKLPREHISKMIDVMFHNYNKYIPNYNQQVEEKDRIGSIRLTYVNNNIYKVLLCDSGSISDQEKLYKYIVNLWTFINALDDGLKRNDGVFIRADNPYIDKVLSINFFILIKDSI